MTLLKRKSHNDQGKKMKLYRSTGGNIVIFIFLTLLSCFMILPMFYAIIQSLKPMEEIFAYPPKFFVVNPTFNNYLQAMRIADNLYVPFSRYVVNSVLVSVIGTGSYVFIAAASGYALAKGKFPGCVLISSLVVWTMLFSGSVTAIPQYVIISGMGMVDSHWAVILPALADTMGIFLMKQFVLSSIPDSVLEAARIDGAGEFKILTKIVFPNIKPACATLVIFTFQALWNNAGSTYIYTESQKLLPTVLSSISAAGLARAGASAAVSVLLMIPPIAIFLYSQSSVMETMSHSGLK